jgi:hypothetical protein
LGYKQNLEEPVNDCFGCLFASTLVDLCIVLLAPVHARIDPFIDRYNPDWTRQYAGPVRSVHQR